MIGVARRGVSAVTVVTSEKMYANRIDPRQKSLPDNLAARVLSHVVPAEARNLRVSQNGAFPGF